MPLNAANFVTKGPVLHADMLQFYNLFTGVMVDQPVTFSNTLSLGGMQGTSTVPLKIYGAPGQTTHLIDLYSDRTNAQPGFGFSAIGTFGWGPGGTAPIDTSLSRIGTQILGTDTPGLLISPQLMVNGNILPRASIVWPSGAALADGGTVVNVSTHLAVQGDIFVGFDRAQYLHEVRPGEIGLISRLLINSADAEGSGLTYAVGYLQTRGADMTDVAGAYSFPLSAHTFAGNWLQFNPKFYKVTAGVGWPGVALLLDYDIDAASPGLGGRIAMMSGMVSVGGLPTTTSTFQVQGSTSLNGPVGVAGAAQFNGNINCDSITIDSAANSPGAKLAFNQTPTPKICLYDAGGGNYFGMGIDSAEVYFCAPTNNVINFRQNNGAGPVMGGFLGTGQFQMNYDIIINPPRVLNLGGALVSPGTNIGKSADTVYLSAHAYVFFDLGVGHVVTCQQLIQTSNPEAKSGVTAFSDANCMARVRGNMPVYQYALDPPTPPPGSPPQPQPTVPDIGFMATDVYANSPEFAGVDSNNNPIGVNYANMSALLWGALRSLDARCVAKGI